MAPIIVGSVGVKVVPIATDVVKDIRAQTNADANKLGKEIGDQIAKGIRDSVGNPLTAPMDKSYKEQQKKAPKQGSETAGAFATAFKKRLQAALRELPKIEIDADSSDADWAIGEVRKKLEELSDKTIGVDLKTEEAQAELDRLRAQLESVQRSDPRVDVQVNVARALAQIEAFKKEVDATLGKDKPIEVEVETERAEAEVGAFAREARARIDAALQSIPDIEVDANTDPARRRLAELRAELASLRDADIGVDIDAGSAQAKIAAIAAELNALAVRDPRIDIEVNAGRAAAELGFVQAQVNALGASSASLGLSGVAGVSGLAFAIGGLAVVAVPAIVATTAAIGALVATLAAAGAGAAGLVAAAAPAFSQIKTVLDAQKQAQDAATRSSANGAKQAAQSAQRALQLAGAQQALAAAERNAARSIEQAQQQVRQAKQSLADTIASAALRQEQADRSVEDAEESLADAQRDATRAQQDLVDARKEAAEQAEDLANRLTDSQLSQRDAALRVQEAQLELNEVLADPEATDLQRARARLAYDEAVQQLKEQQLQTKRLQADKAAADKAGVQGSEVVIAAQERLRQAQEDVADRTQALKDAQAAAARQQVQNARDIADAQAKVAEAEKNVAFAQQAAAESIASAQRGIQAAQLATAGTTDTAAAAALKYREELAKLTPAGRDLMDAWTRLKDAFSDWSKELQPDVLPIFTRGLDGITGSLDSLTPLVQNAAEAVNGLMDDFSAELKEPFWVGFFQDITAATGPAITALGKSIGNIATGIAGIIDAFLPHQDEISEFFVNMTGDFADWGKGLKGSEGFEDFWDWVKENGPKVKDTLAAVGGALGHIGDALKPLGGPALDAIKSLAETIQSIPVDVLTYAAAALAAIAVSLAIIGIVVAIIEAPITLIIVAIVALGAALIYAYNHSETFRNIVDTAFRAIATAASWMWNKVLKPAFDGISWYIQNILIPWFIFLWKYVVKPVFETIGFLIWFWWNYTVKPVFNAVKWFILNVIAPQVRWLYKNIFEPVFKNIGIVVKAAWEKVIKPALDRFKTTIDLLPAALDTLKQAVEKAWKKIGDSAKVPIRFVIETVYNKGIVDTFNKLAGAVGVKFKLEHAKLPKGFATGGIPPAKVGAGFVTDGPRAIVGEGDPAHPEFVIPTDPRYRQNALRLWKLAGGQLFEGGGVLGKLANLGRDVGGFIKDKAAAAADFITDPGKVIDDLIRKPVRDLLRDIGGGTLGRIATQLPYKVIDGLVAKAKGLAADLVPDFGGSGGGGGGSGVERWRSVVLQALGLVGQPASYAGITLRRMNQESGGNPTIVNRWDSNWIAGHPSVGLMQVIRGTFAAYAGRFRNVGPFSYGVSTNPLANIYASMRYALDRYGSLPAAYNRRGGYDQGGMLQPGWTMAYNGTGQPEPVLTRKQFEILARRQTVGPVTQNNYPAPGMDETAFANASARRLGILLGV